MFGIIGRGLLVFAGGTLAGLLIVIGVGRALPPAPQLVTISSPTALRGLTEFTRVDLRTGVAATRRVQLGDSYLSRLYDYPPNNPACTLAFEWKTRDSEQLNITVYDLLEDEWRTHALPVPEPVYDDFQNSHGQWSPDARHLIVPYRGITFLLDTLTGEYVQLPRLLIDRVWSPDGRYVAGSVNTPGGIFIYDTQTDTHLTYDAIPQDPRRFPELVQWSPDGRYLAYIGAGESLAGTFVWLIDTQSETVWQASPMYGDVDIFSQHVPMWSPDSRRFVIRANIGTRFDPIWEVHIVDIDSGESRRLTDSFNEYGFPWRVTWSPAGDWILSVEMQDGDADGTRFAAYLRDPETGERADLPPLPVSRQSALVRWSPGGRYLLLRDAASNAHLIDTTALTGTGLQRPIRQFLGWYLTDRDTKAQTLIFRDLVPGEKRTITITQLQDTHIEIDDYRIPVLRDTDRPGVCYPTDDIP